MYDKLICRDLKLQRQLYEIILKKFPKISYEYIVACIYWMGKRPNVLQQHNLQIALFGGFIMKRGKT